MTARPALLWLALLVGAAHAVAADDLDRVLQSLAQRRHGTAGFVEVQYLALLKRPVESSGELRYDAPDRLEMRTVSPRPESLVLAGDVLTMERGNRHRVLDLKAYPQVLPFIESIRATLAGDRGALERLFTVGFSGSPSHWTLELVPREAAAAKQVSAVRITGTGDDLTEVQIQQPDGDHSLMTLHPLPAP